MVFYNIAPSKIKTIFRKPDRTEEGIAPGTIAAMQVKKSNSAKQKETEIWLMYKINKKRKSRVTMISAWRYPGRTKKGQMIPIPPEILEELQSIL